jgi:prepilin-type N-terminal cleavage/methylation domain-containing protein
MRSSFKRSRARGFSAIELLVVLAIIGFFVGIAIPGFQVIRLGTALSAAQRDVAAAVQNARWRAINTGATHTVNLSAASTVGVTRSGTTVASVALGQYSVTQTHTGGSTFDFDPRGLIPSGTTTPITITLTNSLNATRTVTIDRLGRLTTS